MANPSSAAWEIRAEPRATSLSPMSRSVPRFPAVNSITLTRAIACRRAPPAPPCRCPRRAAMKPLGAIGSLAKPAKASLRPVTSVYCAMIVWRRSPAAPGHRQPTVALALPVPMHAGTPTASRPVRFGWGARGVTASASARLMLASANRQPPRASLCRIVFGRTAKAPVPAIPAAAGSTTPPPPASPRVVRGSRRMCALITIVRA